MFLNRLHRTLSAFDHATHHWAAIPLHNAHDPITQKRPSADTIGKQSLSLTSWNIQASQSGSVARSKLILDHILKGPKFSDIILLQEDDTSFKGLPFATMTFLSSQRFGSPLLAVEGEGGEKLMLDNVFRMELPSRYKRDALCVDIAAPAAPGAVLRLLNVHLDSLDSYIRRVLQMQVLAGVLREPRSSGGIIAGDFNAILPEDHRLVDKFELLDAWVALHGSMRPDGGATWGVGVELKGGLKAGRLDKVAMLGLKPDEIEVLQPGLIEPDRPWSDHCGLRCTFTI
ncbi:Endonuclease/exonuclease/phosphatase [Lactarius akahatsu]|uniref:Endonuclease/exonuclease/phosphatase n=1 Tax=Lactarius akahatsu TaxID=416441 RepID=A0AAD4Q9R6_9AGAM|nr:Endonuclease/exonuclease/phosphatase [Lactarius akahatsu]